MKYKREYLFNLAAEYHLYVSTWSPGDGVTRYKVFAGVKPKSYFESEGEAVLIGLKNLGLGCRVMRQGKAEVQQMIKPSARKNKTGTWSGRLTVFNDISNRRIYSFSTVIERLRRDDALEDAAKELKRLQEEKYEN